MKPKDAAVAEIDEQLAAIARRLLTMFQADAEKPCLTDKQREEIFDMLETLEPLLERTALRVAKRGTTGDN